MKDEPLYLALGKPDRFGVLWQALALCISV
jgi:hypothetical protein